MWENPPAIVLFNRELFARFEKRRGGHKPVTGMSLPHNWMFADGWATTDGNRHTHTNLPLVLAGAGGGHLTPGRYTRFEAVPMSNLLLSLTDRLGVRGVERLGDSSGRIEGV